MKAFGRCLCNAVGYEITAAPFDCCYCHCSICRRLTGADKGCYGTIRKEDFSWVSGEGLLIVYAQNDRIKRMSCSICGCYLVSTHSLAPGNYYLSLGCLQSDKTIKIDYQQFVASKAPWTHLDPAIKQYQAWPDWIHERIQNECDNG